MPVLSTARDSRYLLLTQSASLHCLSDDSLLAIFHQLPVFDLVRAHCICRRWKALAPIVCRRRQALLLLDDTKMMTEVLSDFSGTFFELSQYLVKDDGSPAVHQLTDEQYALCVKPHSPDNELAFTQAQFWSHLPELFPNVHRLYVSLMRTTPIIELLTRLLTKWGPNLGRLQLHYWNCDSSVNDDEKMVSALGSLLERINSMERLRHLSFNFQPNPSFSGSLTLHLPVISQLKSLTLEFYNPTCVAMKSLGKQLGHLSEQSAAQRVTIQCHLEEATLLTVPSSIARLFTDLWLPRQIDEENLGQFGRLVGHFACVTHLRFKTALPLHRLAPLLAELPHLTCLFLKYSCKEDPPSEEFLSSDHLRVPSVKGLFLLLSLQRHIHVKYLSLGTLFPSVQVASIGSYALVCYECHYNHYNSAFDDNWVTQCDQKYEKYLHFLFPKLRTVLRAERASWRSWGPLKPVTV